MDRNKIEKKQSILDQVMADPQMLKQDPELLKIAMIEFANSIETRLKEIEKRWSKPLI
jgi:hypothetical protein